MKREQKQKNNTGMLTFEVTQENGKAIKRVACSIYGK